jgi:hypothetical protein
MRVSSCAAYLSMSAKCFSNAVLVQTGSSRCNFPLASVRLKRTELFSAASNDECAMVWRWGLFIFLMAFSRPLPPDRHAGALSDACRSTIVCIKLTLRLKSMFAVRVSAASSVNSNSLATAASRPCRHAKDCGATARMDRRAFCGPARQLARREGRPSRSCDVSGRLCHGCLLVTRAMADAQSSRPQHFDPPEHDQSAPGSSRRPLLDRGAAHGPWRNSARTGRGRGGFKAKYNPASTGLGNHSLELLGRLCLCGYLSNRTRTSLRRSAVHAIPVPIKITASVALKLPGVTQLMQEVTSVGTSFI